MLTSVAMIYNLFVFFVFLAMPTRIFQVKERIRSNYLRLAQKMLWLCLKYFAYMQTTEKMFLHQVRLFYCSPLFLVNATKFKNYILGINIFILTLVLAICPSNFGSIHFTSLVWTNFLLSIYFVVRSNWTKLQADD